MSTARTHSITTIFPAHQPEIESPIAPAIPKISTKTLEAQMSRLFSSSSLQGRVTPVPTSIDLMNQLIEWLKPYEGRPLNVPTINALILEVATVETKLNSIKPPIFLGRSSKKEEKEQCQAFIDTISTNLEALKEISIRYPEHPLFLHENFTETAKIRILAPVRTPLDLGSGSFGSITRECRSSGDIVIKAPISKSSSLERAHDCLLQESLLLFSLPPHDRIIRFLGLTPLNNLIFQYATNGDLFHALNSLTESQSDDILRKIAEGISFLHDHNIIHADLKPENILLDEHMNPKIADFGAAARGEFNDNETYTPGYGAPEQTDNQPGITSKADVWALGCIIYILLTKAEFCGRLLKSFPETNFLTQENWHTGLVILFKNSNRPLVQSVIHKIIRLVKDRPWNAVLEKTLHIDPKERYPIQKIIDELLTRSEPASAAVIPSVPLRPPHNTVKIDEIATLEDDHSIEV